MSEVNAQVGFTKNMGNFESARIDIGFRDTVRQDEEVSDAQNRVYKVAEDELIKRLQELVDEINEVNGGK